MNLKEAIEILKENHYKIKSTLLNEADLHFSTADQFLSFTQSRGYYQNTVKIGTINTMLSEKELNAAGKDIGEIVIERYCKDFESTKKRPSGILEFRLGIRRPESNDRRYF